MSESTLNIQHVSEFPITVYRAWCDVPTRSELERDPDTKRVARLDQHTILRRTKGGDYRVVKEGSGGNGQLLSAWQLNHWGYRLEPAQAWAALMVDAREQITRAEIELKARLLRMEAVEQMGKDRGWTI